MKITAFNAEISPGFIQQINILKTELSLLPAEILASRTGSSFNPLDNSQGEFHFNFFNDEVIGTYPGIKFMSSSGSELPDFQQLLFLYYFAANNTPTLNGDFVTFADLPEGRIYSSAFQRYTGDIIDKNFANNISLLKAACEDEKGIAIPFADLSYRFHVLPNIIIQLVYWLGDDDFPGNCTILFDRASTFYLPIDVCAIIGKDFTRRIIKHLKK